QQVLHQDAQLLVKGVDVLGGGAQDRIAVDADGLDRQCADLSTLGLAALQCPILRSRRARGRRGLWRAAPRLRWARTPGGGPRPSRRPRSRPGRALWRRPRIPAAPWLRPASV